MKRLVIAFFFMSIFAGGSHAQELNAKEQGIVKRVEAYHQKNLECDGRGSDMQETQFIRFKKKSDYGFKSSVVLVTCSFHAYQVSWVAYSVFGEGRSDDDFSILSFPSTNDGKEWTADKFLMSPDWDPKSKTLNTFYKGRGKVDCGSYESYRWNGYSFYLYSSNYQVCCWNEETFEKVPACMKIKKSYPRPIDEWPQVFKYKGE